MSYQSKELGDYGEELACHYLEKKGYSLVGKKIKLFCGEIDLLFQDKNSLVIVEVKTKTDRSFGVAADMITYKKQRKLLQLARALWQKYPDMNIRIDVIAIDFRNHINHIINAVTE